jgi:hypothetical protein
MSSGGSKQNMLSRMQCSAIIYAIASCVNLREELLALQASFPMFKTAALASLTAISQFLVFDMSELFSRKTSFLS